MSDATRAGWEAAAAAVLRKGRRLADDDPDAAVWDALTTTTYDGVAVTPLGTPDDVETVAARPLRDGDWDVRVRHSGTGEQAVAELEAGASSLWVSGVTDLASALDGVLLDLAPVVLDGATIDEARGLVSLGVLHPDTNLGAAPDSPDLVDMARLARQEGIRAVVVDATGVHEQGASDAQELGAALADGASAVRTLTDAGVEAADAFGLLEFRLAATDEQFPTIAKLRAFRRCWSRVAELSGVEDPRTRIHAVTSRAMLSAYDIHVNMLRGTIAAFAAGVGGADAITVTPYDEPIGGDSPLGRRVARNTSALLLQESHVGRVADPAGGSYVTESLTDQLAAAAWAELGLIETSGRDALDARIAEVVARRDTDVADRSRPLTGLTEFPQLADPTPTGDDGVRRWGAAFEELRTSPPAGSVFLATMGPLAAHTARATFATNLFAAGGIPVVVAGPTDDVSAVLAAYSGEAVACLAGTDAAYAEWGADLVAALRDAGASRVVIAGRPIEGVDDSAALGVDALAFLTRTREALA